MTPEVCLPQYQRDANTLAGWGVDASRTNVFGIWAALLMASEMFSCGQAVKLDWCKFNGSPGNQQPLTDAFGTALSRTGRPIFFAFHCGAAWADWCPLAGKLLFGCERTAPRPNRLGRGDAGVADLQGSPRCLGRRQRRLHLGVLLL